LITKFSIEKIRFGEMTGGMERHVLLCARGIETPTEKAIQFVSNSAYSLDPVSVKADCT
jgi:hypothetical protein